MRLFASAPCALALCAIVGLTGCRRAPEKSDASALRYEARGLVRGVGPNHRSIDVQHEDIRGFMPSMTMPFIVRDPKEVASIVIGDAISFDLHVTENDSWIDHVQKIKSEELHLPTPAPTVATHASDQSSPRLREGDDMPSFELTSESGKRITLETFRGRPFVMTFIFTRCPIPNFCPLMSKNFLGLQKAIQGDSGPAGQARLLSVSIDPDFDTSQVLETYARYQQADSKIWTFATGEKSEVESLARAFSVYIQPEGGSISHGLATALINKDGKVERIWRGNGWTVDEVVQSLRERSKSK